MFFPMINLPPVEYIPFMPTKCEERILKEGEWAAQGKDCPRNCCVAQLSGANTCPELGYTDYFLGTIRVCYKCWVPRGPG